MRTITTDPRAEDSYAEVDWTTPYAVIVGEEAAGLSKQEIVVADQTVRVPMCGEVESLNVTVALALIVYEAARQRKKF